MAERDRPRCKTCGKLLILYRDGAACSDMRCGGIVGADEIGNIDALRMRFPDQRSDCKADKFREGLIQ